MKKNPSVIVIGAGPAGLTAAYELIQQGIHPLVLEGADKVGGISRTESYKGYRFDIGGHRFFTKVGKVNQLWQEMLGKELISVSRLSRIYYRGKFFNYPLSLFDTLFKLGISESLLIFLSYVRAKWSPIPQEKTLEDWVTNRFGYRLFRTFFKTYTEKVWGIRCDQIQADWAAQRIKGLSLKTALLNAISGRNNTTTLIEKFDYPILGPGLMWQRFREAIERQGGQVWLNAKVIRLERQGQTIHHVVIERNGETVRLSADHFISSMPLSTLQNQLDPAPPANILQAANSLTYRAFIVVALIVDRDNLFPDNWIYIHSPHLQVGRIQNFKNWSAAMVPDPTKTCLGMEYFCMENDATWNISDSQLIELATGELVKLGLAQVDEIQDGCVLRQAKAYPIYDQSYRQHLQALENYLTCFKNLQTIGRNGMHRYNNQDHSMLTGILAARNILGENHNLWDVNTERSYHEEFITAPSEKPIRKSLFLKT